MKFSHFFIDRPRFAAVLSILIFIAGALSFTRLPLSQYPDIAPPQIQVKARYPGANAETVANTVAAPLEQEINGVEDMIYLSSQSTNDGNTTISVTFKPGTNMDLAQLAVQNRVALAEARLPAPVRRQGVATIKNAPDILTLINLVSVNDAFDQDFLGSFASLQVKDFLAREPGVGTATVFGGSQYSMRVWIDPDRAAELDISAGEILAAIRSENIQVSGGVLNQYPVPSQQPFEVVVETQGRLSSIEAFEDIIIKSSEQRIVKLRDVARVSVEQENFVSKGYYGEDPQVSVLVTKRPGANALETAQRVMDRMDDLAKKFPPGVEYRVLYNPAAFVEASMKEVYVTLLQALVLVVVVILVFLRSWRTALIPVITIPISLVGSLSILLALGYSLNMLTLFGLILSIGIVVDDTIVVVENVKRRLNEGLTGRDAAYKTMDEVGMALLATSFVLVAVFLPTFFMEGMTGTFYKQFGVTITAATLISTVISLTLSPSFAVLLMRADSLNNKGQESGKKALIDRAMEWLSEKYGQLVVRLLRISAVVFALYLGLVYLAGNQFASIPTGFVPDQDQGYAFVVVQLPPGSSITRTDEAMLRAAREIDKIPALQGTLSYTGYDGATDTFASNTGAIYAVLKPSSERENINAVTAQMWEAVGPLDEAAHIVAMPPPVTGIGTIGGFKMMVQDRAGKGSRALHAAITELAAAATQAPELAYSYSLFEVSSPRVFLDIDRDRARKLGVPMTSIFETLETYIGTAYVNDFDMLGRNFRVTAQADSEFRLTKDDLLRLRVRSSNGEMVPIGSVASIEDTSGPSRVPRYNLFPAAAVTAAAAPGYSSGQAMQRMEQLAEEILPIGFEFEWTELAFQQKTSSNSMTAIFTLAVLFVFLLLAAQYESWTLPLSIILIVPMCVLSAAVGLLVTELSNDILTQVGLVVLVGLAAKNAILIVEFAKQNEEFDGMSVQAAIVDACKTRLRPILMTALSFIFGVVSLLVASGPGFEMRRAIGVTVFSGMTGVTIFGLLLTPVFYYLVRRLKVKSSGAD